MNVCRLSLVACHGCLASALMSVADLFTNANHLAQSASRKPSACFDLQIVSPDGGHVRCSNGYNIQVDGGLELVESSDIVIFYPPFLLGQHAQSSALHYLQNILPTFKDNIKQIPLFIVDKSEQLFSTHEKPLESKFSISPFNLVDLFKGTPNQLTSIMYAASPTRWLDVCLSIIEERLGKNIVKTLTDYLVTQAHSPDSGGNITTQADKQAVETSNIVVNKAQAWIQGNLSNRFGVEDVAKHVAVSTRTLIRYFQDYLGKSPLNYIQQSRIEKCKTLLRTTNFSFTKITDLCGYKDESAFRKLFKKNCSLSPSQYRRQSANDIDRSNGIDG